MCVNFVPHTCLQRVKEEVSYEWGNGAARRDAPESVIERAATHRAAHAGVEESVAASLRAAEQARLLREAQRLEAVERKNEREKLSFNAREKRKRERGQAIGGQDFNQEEKRLQRGVWLTAWNIVFRLVFLTRFFFLLQLLVNTQILTDGHGLFCPR